MRKLIGSAVLAAVLLTTPALAAAQRRRAAAPAGGPTHEMGVDLAAYYSKPSGADGGIRIGLPVDVRVGFLTRSQLMWEGRASFALSSVGTTTTYEFAPGVSVLHQLKRGTGTRGLIRAPYVRGGAQLTLFDTGPTSGSQFSLGGGVGTRAPFQSAAFRYEGFFAYAFKGGGRPSNFAIGTLVGLSFWH